MVTEYSQSDGGSVAQGSTFADTAFYVEALHWNKVDDGGEIIGEEDILGPRYQKFALGLLIEWSVTGKGVYVYGIIFAR